MATPAGPVPLPGRARGWQTVRARVASRRGRAGENRDGQANGQEAIEEGRCSGHGGRARREAREGARGRPQTRGEGGVPPRDGAARGRGPPDGARGARRLRRTVRPPIVEVAEQPVKPAPVKPTESKPTPRRRVARARAVPKAAGPKSVAKPAAARPAAAAKPAAAKPATASARASPPRPSPRPPGPPPPRSPPRPSPRPPGPRPPSPRPLVARRGRVPAPGLPTAERRGPGSGLRRSRRRRQLGPSAGRRGRAGIGSTRSPTSRSSWAWATPSTPTGRFPARHARS